MKLSTGAVEFSQVNQSLKSTCSGVSGPEYASWLCPSLVIWAGEICLSCLHLSFVICMVQNFCGGCRSIVTSLVHSKERKLVAQSCSTLCNSTRGPHLTLQPTRLLGPWDSPGKNSGVGCHFLLQGIIPNPGLGLPTQTRASCTAGRFFTNWATGRRYSKSSITLNYSHFLVPMEDWFQDLRGHQNPWMLKS